jgi:PPP family 3-phenylpropionic acid transporter
MVGVAFTLPRTPPPARAFGRAGEARGREGDAPYGEALRRLLSRRGFGLFMVLVFLMFSSLAAMLYYSPLLLDDLGFERKWIGPVQCVGVLAEIPLFFSLSVVLRRLGYRGTILLGAIALLARQLIYATCESRWLLAGSYILTAFCVVFCLVGVSLAINEIAERSVRASAQTLLALVGPGLGQMAGHQTVGWIAKHAAGGLRTGFWFASGTAALAVLILVFVLRGSHLFGKEQVTVATQGLASPHPGSGEDKTLR